MDFNNLIFRLKNFIQYKIQAVGAHTLHSPFLFDMYNHVIKKSEDFESLSIEKLRKRLLRNRELIEVLDFKTAKVEIKSIGNITRSSASQKKFSFFLLQLINYLKADSILETGTSLGINTLYLAKSTARQVITIEGSSVIAQLAQRNFDQLKQSKIKLINGDLYESFEQMIVRYKPDFYFLDADHRSSAIAFCIDLILKHTPNAKCIVIHDIYWSQDMNAIWNDLREDPRFALSIDIFQAGLLFPKREMPKQHFTLRF